MDWLILILGVPAILIPLVLLFGFAGCVQTPVSRHPRRAPAARPRAVSGNGLVAPWRHRVHLALAQILPARKLRAGRPGLVWTGPLFPGTAARSPRSHRRPGAHQSMRRRRTRLGRRRRFAGEGIRIVSRVRRQRRRTDFPVCQGQRVFQSSARKMENLRALTGPKTCPPPREARAIPAAKCRARNVARNSLSPCSLPQRPTEPPAASATIACSRIPFTNGSRNRVLRPTRRVRWSRNLSHASSRLDRVACLRSRKTSNSRLLVCPLFGGKADRSAYDPKRTKAELKSRSAAGLVLAYYPLRHRAGS